MSGISPWLVVGAVALGALGVPLWRWERRARARARQEFLRVVRDDERVAQLNEQFRLPSPERDRDSLP
jgi:hypothetical protein